MAHQAPTSDSPKGFNKLPNELLKAILVKVDTQKLFPLRAVSSRWNAVIEKICHKEKCLIIMSSESPFRIGPFVEQYFARSTEKPIILKIDPLLPIVSNRQFILLSEDFVLIVMRLFPQIHKFLFEPVLSNQLFSIRNFFRLLTCWSSCLVVLSLEKALPESVYPDLCDHINRLINLRRLNLGSYTLRDHPALLAPTFGRLECLSIFYFFEANLLTVIGLLGRDCLSLFVRGVLFPLSLPFVSQWHERNPRLVTDLKCLRLSIDSLDVLDFVCDRFVSLQTLHLNQNDLVANMFPFEWFSPLGRLAHLRELSLSNCTLQMYRINLDTLEREHPSPALVNIRVLSLIHCDTFRPPLTNHNFNGFTNFCLDLSNIFPNLERLYIQLRPQHAQQAQLITGNVGMFRNLRSHRVWV